MSVETTSVQQSDGRARLAQRTSSRSVEQTPDLHALNSATREAVHLALHQAGQVAAPIRDFSGAVLASVGCCLPLGRLTDATLPTLAAPTTETAAAISADLGFVVPESPRDRSP